MRRQLCGGLILLAVFASKAAAQNDDEFDRLNSKIIQHLETKMTGWTHKEVAPIQGSKGTVIHHWQNSNRVVTVSIVKYSSASQALDAMQPFIQYERQKEELKGFGANAYAWGYGLASIVFRRGRFIFYVETYAAVESDPDAQTLSATEKGNRERSEMKRLSMEFAKHMATAVDQP